MRDDTKEQLDIINNKIEKAKTSLEAMEEISTPKAVAAEFVDLLPLGQFPEDTPPPPEDDDNKPHRS